MADLQQPLTDPEYGDEHSRIQRKCLNRVGILSGFILIALIGAFVFFESQSEISHGKRNLTPVTSRGASAGVSEKKFRLKSGASPFPWSNDMLSWQKTAFHFQPRKNWMNDPNGPLFYKGWYHLFYQYNPEGAVWGNIVWGHAVSRDLINWQHLPLAMVADRWYDINGVWTGSATLLPDGRIIMLYTGSTNNSVQVQNLAYPEDPSDPLLINWVKYSGNPVLFPPPGIDIKDFRDPTTAWYTPDEKWRIVIGSKVKKTGISLIYDTSDFMNYELKPGILHGVPGTGMWECVDFYPVSRIDENGLDTSFLGPDVKHVLKASLDDDKNDYYALGRYFHENATWLPDDRSIDVGIGLRYDYGDFYASKTFYDEKKQRRILWGWIRETDSERADVMKGWASLQSIPRTVFFDRKTSNGIIQWPVEEIETLRTTTFTFDRIEIRNGSLFPLDVGQTTQLDIIAEFEIQKNVVEVAHVDGDYDCHGAARRGALGPFGLLVLANDDVSEHTAFYFYLAKGVNGSLKYFFCSDESRSSKATDVAKEIHGSIVPVLDGERLSMRLLVDHSIVESFAMGGRSCITSRVYPTSPAYGDARVFLFNNATTSVVSASVKVWQMKSARKREYVPHMKM